MWFKFIVFDPELVRLKDCIVYDVDNWEGDFGYLHIKMMNGKFVEPNSKIISVSFWQWNSITDPSVYSSGHEWVAGTKHPKDHAVATEKGGTWLPEEGYEWAEPPPNNKDVLWKVEGQNKIIKKKGEAK